MLHFALKSCYIVVVTKSWTDNLCWFSHWFLFNAREGLVCRTASLSLWNQIRSRVRGISLQLLQLGLHFRIVTFCGILHFCFVTFWGKFCYFRVDVTFCGVTAGPGDEVNRSPSLLKHYLWTAFIFYYIMSR